MKVLTEVGRLIRKHRNTKGWSQEELADRAGVHRTFISSIERGVRNPTVTSLHRIASAMELTVSELMDGHCPGKVSINRPALRSVHEHEPISLF